MSNDNQTGNYHPAQLKKWFFFVFSSTIVAVATATIIQWLHGFIRHLNICLVFYDCYLSYDAIQNSISKNWFDLCPRI